MGELTVLVAEDEPAMRGTIELWLEDTGWTVLTAEDGREAVEKLDEDVDILVCDRRMPKMNASDVLARLERTDIDIPVIILTAYEPDEKLDEADVDAYLNKPVKKPVLKSVINRLATR